MASLKTMLCQECTLWFKPASNGSQNFKPLPQFDLYIAGRVGVQSQRLFTTRDDVEQQWTGEPN